MNAFRKSSGPFRLAGRLCLLVAWLMPVALGVYDATGRGRWYGVESMIFYSILSVPVFLIFVAAFWWPGTAGAVAGLWSLLQYFMLGPMFEFDPRYVWPWATLTLLGGVLCFVGFLGDRE